MNISFKKLCFAALCAVAFTFAQEPWESTYGATPEPESEPASSYSPPSYSTYEAAPQPEPEPTPSYSPSSYSYSEPESAPEPKKTEVFKAKPPPQETGFFKLGVRGAVGFSNLSGHFPIRIDKVDMYLEPAIQLTGGVHTEFNFEPFALEPELQYTWYRQNKKRIELKNNDIINTREAEVTIHAIEIPVLFRFDLPFSIYAEIGPQAGFVLHSVTDKKNENNGTAYRDESEDTKDLNIISYGGTAGLGVNMGDISVGARYHLGLREYAENTNGYPWLVQIGITYNFLNN